MKHFYSTLRQLNKQLNLRRSQLPRSLKTPSHEKSLETQVALGPSNQFSAAAQKMFESWRSPSIEAAIEHMQHTEWPHFLLFDVMSRENNSRMDSFRLAKLYEEQIAKIEAKSQLEFTMLTLKAVSNKWIDFTVPICRLFVRLAAPDPEAINSLLLFVTQIGTVWKSTELSTIKEAQKVLVGAMEKHQINEKGLFALAYLAHFDSLQLALDLAGLMANNSYKTQIKLFCCSSFEHGLEIINSVSAPARHSSMWEAFLQRIVVLDAPEKTFLQLRKYFELNKIAISPTMARWLLKGIKSFEHRLKVASLSYSSLPHIFSPVKDEQSYRAAKQLAYAFPSYAVISRFVNMQAEHEPELVWDNYLALQRLGDVNELVLEALCLAASRDPLMVWGDKTAAQQVVVEFKSNVRSDRSDTLKVYPTPRLVHLYVRLLASAGYDAEVDRLWPWLQRLGFEPDKRTLCALVLASPYSGALKRLSRGKDGWPTAHELELYKQGALIAT